MSVTTTTANGPQTGGGGGSFATITGNPSDNAALQAALDLKAPLTSPAFLTSARFSYGTASTVPYWNATKDLVSSAVTPTELGYVAGVTSAIQTQMDLKAPLASPTFTGTPLFPSGSASTPGVAFSASPSSGMYWAGGGSGSQVIFAVSGAINAALEADQTQFVTAATTTNYSVFRSVATGGLSLSGGSSATNGMNWQLYGGSHASLSGTADLRSGSTIWMRLQNAALALNPTTATAAMDIYRGADTGSIRVIGGTSTSSGYLAVYSATHASKASYVEVFAGSGVGLTLAPASATMTLATTFSAGVASTTTTTGTIIVTGGIGATGAINHAGTYRCTNTTDSTSTSSGAAVISGGLAIAKTLYVGTAVNVVTGNVLITSGNLGRDTGSSGLMTDCPTNIFCTTLQVKTNIAFAANSATAGLNLTIDSGTSITVKQSSTGLLGISSTQLNLFKRVHYGANENTILDFPAATISSTSATPVTALAYDTSGRDNWVFKMEIMLVCRRSDSGTEYGHFSWSFLFSREGGVNTLRDSKAIHTDGLSTLTTATIQGAVSGNNILCQLVGEAGKTLKGTCFGTITMVST